jgi:hypothetical protein
MLCIMLACATVQFPWPFSLSWSVQNTKVTPRESYRNLKTSLTYSLTMGDLARFEPMSGNDDVNENFL